MNILFESIRQIIQWITEPPGDLFYFLATLFALQISLFIALTARKNAPDRAGPHRWSWAIGGMLLGKVILIILSLLGNEGLFKPAAILPPLERWLEFSSIVLIMWAALFKKRSGAWQNVALILLLASSFVFYVYGAQSWPPWEANNYAYNGFLQEQIWEILALGFLLLHLILTLIMRPPEWEWTTGILLFWFLGHAAQLRWPDVQMHFSGWLRLTALVIYPLIPTLINRQLSASTRPVTQTAPDLNIEMLEKTIQNIESARELEPSLMIASSRLASLLKAELCAIALNVAGKENKVRIVAVHPLNAAQIRIPELQLHEYDLLLKAYTQKEILAIQDPLNPTWLSDLYQHMEFDHTGPLMVYPLYHKDQNLGLLLLGNPQSARLWKTPPAATQELITRLVAAAIYRARTQGDSLLQRMRTQEDAQRQKLEIMLQKSQSELDGLNNRITVLVKEIKTRDKEILQLTQTTESKKQGPSETEINFWQNEVRELAKEREALESKVQELGQKEQTFNGKIETLSKERDVLRDKTELSNVEKAALLSQVKELLQDREVLIDERNRLAGQLSEMKINLDNALDHQLDLEKQLTTSQYELQESHKATLPQECQISSLPASVAVGLVVVDEDGMITMADALARQIMRLPKGNVIGMPINGAYPDPRWSQLVAALLAKDIPKPINRAHLSLTHENSAIEADMVTLRGKDGQPDGLAITLRTPESDVERQEAIVSLANEFRTPMTAITGYIDLLMKEQAGILTEMQQQFLNRAKANTEQLGHLLNDLVQMASPDSRPIELSPQPVNLIDIIEEAVLGLEARFKERKLDIRLDLPPELTAVQVDRDSLYQILLRLISNAALCSKENTEIVVHATEDNTEADGNYIRISVTDSGGGIASDDYPRVFRRFYRASQPLVQGMGETGVGMAVAKTLVEANSGRIWVESEDGVGSTFSFILPIKAEE